MSKLPHRADPEPSLDRQAGGSKRCSGGLALLDPDREVALAIVDDGDPEPALGLGDRDLDFAGSRGG